MDFKKLDKAKKIFEKIIVLDAEIIEIDKIANSVANEDVQVTLSLSVRNLSKDSSNSVGLDEDGSLVYGSMKWLDYGSLFGFGSSSKKQKENKFTERIEKQVSESVSLNILGVLLAEKNLERDILIKELSKLGVTE